MCLIDTVNMKQNHDKCSCCNEIPKGQIKMFDQIDINNINEPNILFYFKLKQFVILLIIIIFIFTGNLNYLI